MAHLIYSSIQSLDGYVADRDGGFEWAAPDEEVHTFVNEMERSIGTYLYGRRMYDVMAAWETMDEVPDLPAVAREYTGIWRAADKVVFSRSLGQAVTPRTRVERDFDPQLVREWKDSAQRDLSVGGAHLAGQAIRTGLVDELHLFIVPAIVGGGTRSLPDDFRVDLELADERRFGNGTAYVRYRVSAPRA